MPVAELWLHDVGRLQPGGVHEVNIVGLANWIVGIVVLELAKPYGVDQVALFIVWSVFQKRLLAEFLFLLGIPIT